MADTITWGDLKSWAQANQVPDDAELWNRDTDEPFKDVDSSPATEAIEPGPNDEGEEAAPAQLLLSEVYDG